MPNDRHALTLFVCGDVMTGRGIDQVLPHPVNPQLFEDYVQDAREYVRLAEEMNGPIPKPVDVAYPWGDTLAALRNASTDARIINLETSLTSGGSAWPEKGINYRMHPRNIGCLTTARIDCCCLGNNHVLDWGYAGLAETLQTLDAAGIAHPGAGRHALEAGAPGVIAVPGKGRVLVYSCGDSTSGIPPEWAATEDRAGVNWLPDLCAATARTLTQALQAVKRPGDVAMASIHWGPNWDYAVPDAQVDFAHRLVDGGFDVVHGHSSHHMKAIEVYRGRLILYGCGDFLDDYEGIWGYEEFRPELRLGYFVRIHPEDGRLLDVRLDPVTMRRFQLHPASEAEVAWICRVLNDLGAPFGTQVRREADGKLSVQWR